MDNILKELNISSEKYKSRIIYTYKYIALQKEFDVMTLLFNKIELNECLHSIISHLTALFFGSKLALCILL